MRKSIFTEYFYLCASIVAGAVICVGAVLIMVSSENYKVEQRNNMLHIVDAVYATTQCNYTATDANVEEHLTNIYTNVSDFFNIDFILADKGGKILAKTTSATFTKQNTTLDKSVLDKVDDDGYFTLGTLNNYFSKSCFSLTEEITLAEKECYLIAVVPIDEYSDYMIRLIAIYAISTTLIIILIVFPVIYFAMGKLLRPVKEMTLAAKRFGEGDFSKKLYITEDNELGYLANSLNEMASSLSVLEENRKSFVSNVSHELKTPMTTIGGFVDGILDGTIPKEMHKHYLTIVSTEVDRLSRLVRSMLNISKYESGEVKMTTESFDIVPLVARTVFLFEQKINVKEVDITGLDANMFIVNADKDLIQQVLYNLIENAVKFVNNGGYIMFDFSQTEENVTVRIRNSGQGLKEGEISRVFDRFYKADQSRGMDKTGVGLGLSIVSSIIRLHKGIILVRSEWNEYTEFEFTIARGTLAVKK